MPRSVKCMVLAGAIALAAAGARAESKVTDLKAFYREGQVFITFRELDDVKGEKYAVYRFGSAPSKVNLSAGEKLAVIDEGSGVFKSELRLRRKLRPRGDQKPWTDQPVTPLENAAKAVGYGHRYFIHDNPTNDPKAMLPAGVGLFVYTVRKPAKAYYMVVPVIDGKEAHKRMSALTGPVAEKAELPGAVLVWRHPDRAGTQ